MSAKVLTRVAAKVLPLRPIDQSPRSFPDQAKHARHLAGGELAEASSTGSISASVPAEHECAASLHVTCATQPRTRKGLLRRAIRAAKQCRFAIRRRAETPTSEIGSESMSRTRHQQATNSFVALYVVQIAVDCSLRFDSNVSFHAPPDGVAACHMATGERVATATPSGKH